MHGTEITSGLRFPEGPVALPDGSFLVVEVLAGYLTRVRADGTVEPLAELGGGPNGAAIGPDGRCYVCNNGGITPEEIEHLQSDAADAAVAPPAKGRINVVDLATGAWSVLYDCCDGEHLVAPNDLVFDSAGGFYFTDFGALQLRAPQPSSVYYARADGSAITRVARGLVRANGVGLAPDEKTLYVAETWSGCVWAFDVIGPGVLAGGQSTTSGGRLVYRDPDLHFDSLAIDAQGHICVATTYRGSVARITPDGRECMHFELPSTGVTNVCFGGPGLGTAYITASNEGKLLALAWPCAGLPLNFLNKS